MARSDLLFMTKDIMKGRNSRKILTIIATLFAAAMMLAAPLLTVTDTDADLTSAEEGICIDMKNPTQEDLTTYGFSGDSVFLLFVIYDSLEIFNQDIFEEPVVVAELPEIVDGGSEKVESDTFTLTTVDKVKSGDTTITMVAKEDGPLINPYISVYPEYIIQAANAVKAYLGNSVATGDKIVITGKIDYELAMQNITKYTLLDGNKCVIKSEVDTTYVVEDIDVNIKLVKTDSQRSFQLVSDIKGMFVDEWKYEYGATPVVPGTGYTAKNTVINTYGGNMHMTVDGKDYVIDEELKAKPDKTGTADIIDQSSIVIDDDLKQKIANVPGSKDNVNVDKTSSGVESAFNSVVMDAVGDDIMKILIIAGAVILGIVVLIAIIIVILVVKKSRRS